MSSGEPDIFEVLGNETRRKILEILSEEPAYLNELSRELRVSQQAILKHLEYLLNKGLIEPCDVEDAGGTPPKKYYRLSKSLLFFGELAPNMMEYIVSSPTQALDRTSYRIDIDAQMLRAKLEQIVVGMTLVPEVNLAKEMGMCYSTLALVTDYDVWADKPVTAQEVVETQKANVEKAKKILFTSLEKAAEARSCMCKHSMDNAFT